MCGLHSGDAHGPWPIPPCAGQGSQQSLCAQSKGAPLAHGLCGSARPPMEPHRPRGWHREMLQDTEPELLLPLTQASGDTTSWFTASNSVLLSKQWLSVAQLWKINWSYLFLSSTHDLCCIAKIKSLSYLIRICLVKWLINLSNYCCWLYTWRTCWITST